jgi:hypothetical protein
MTVPLLVAIHVTPDIHANMRAIVVFTTGNEADKSIIFFVVIGSTVITSTGLGTFQLLVRSLPVGPISRHHKVVVLLSPGKLIGLVCPISRPSIDFIFFGYSTFQLLVRSLPVGPVSRHYIFVVLSSPGKLIGLVSPILRIYIAVIVIIVTSYLIMISKGSPAYFIAFITGRILFQPSLPALIIVFEFAGEFVLIITSPFINTIPVLLSALWAIFTITITITIVLTGVAWLPATILITLFPWHASLFTFIRLLWAVLIAWSILGSKSIIHAPFHWFLLLFSFGGPAVKRWLGAFEPATLVWSALELTHGYWIDIHPTALILVFLAVEAAVLVVPIADCDA